MGLLLSYPLSASSSSFALSAESHLVLALSVGSPEVFVVCQKREWVDGIVRIRIDAKHGEDGTDQVLNIHQIGVEGFGSFQVHRSCPSIGRWSRFGRAITFTMSHKSSRDRRGNSNPQLTDSIHASKALH